jgi:SAM-dependent methyltransferase
MVKPHPYVKDGLTNEYVQLCNALRAVVASLGWRNGVALDLGAGDGMLTALLSNAAARVIAVDEDDRALRWARRFVGRSNVVKLDALRFLELSEGGFDLIMMSHLLYYFHEAKWPVILEVAARKLAPNGVLVLCLWSRSCDAATIFRKISSRRREKLYGEHAIDIATSHGFRVTHEQTIKARHWFPSFQTPELIDFFTLGAPDPSICSIQVLREFLSGGVYSVSQNDLLIAFTK